jgi:hypothetical protein
MDSLYMDTIEDMIITRHDQLTEHIPLTEDFSLFIKGRPIPAQATDMLETVLDDFIDSEGASTSLVLGFDPLSEQLTLRGISAQLKTTDGTASITQLQGSSNGYIFSRSEAIMPEMPITSHVDKSFVDSLMEKLDLGQPETLSMADQRAWGRKILAHSAITAWHLKQSAPLAYNINSDSTKPDNMVYAKFAANKEISVTPHRGGQLIKEMRALTHDIVVDTGGSHPVTHRDILIKSSLQDTNSAEISTTFGIYQQADTRGIETPLSPQRRTHHALMQHLMRLEALRQDSFDAPDSSRA